MRESAGVDGFQNTAPAVVETARAVVAGYRADAMDEVWIVDDDQSIRWVLERALAKEGFKVRSFREARDVIVALDDVATFAVHELALDAVARLAVDDVEADAFRG